jgi:hypothetical protein
MNDRKLTRRSFSALLLAVLAASAARGEDWAKEMFDHTSHDFKTVARGTKVEHSFPLENIYNEEVHIESIRATCGCTLPRISARTLKTWDKAEIVVALDTRGHLHQKDSTLTVVFDKPFRAEVQLHVRAYIRSDIVITPGSVTLPSVPQGVTARRKLAIKYAGRSDWKIEKVECSNPHLEARLTKVPQETSTQEIDYELLVSLKPDAPVGDLRAHIVLLTNDTRTWAARIPIIVEGAVVAPLTVRPSPLLLGVVAAGETVSRRLVVEGKTPFRIVAAACGDGRFKCPVEATEKKTVHVLPIVFSAGEDPEKVTAAIRIETDLPESKAIEVPVYVKTVASRPRTF